ncbi:MAG: methylaspartate mutase subunit E, partial [Chloroflexota bacterium]
MSVVIKGRWDEEAFEKERREVLATWPTGKQVDFKEACSYLKKLPEGKIAYNKFINAVAEGITMVQPRAGIAPLEAFIDTLLRIQDYGGADLLPVTVDSETRHQQYEKAEEGIKESEKTGKS